MDIIKENSVVDFENLIVLRKKIYSDQLNDELNKLLEYMASIGFSYCGTRISAIHSSEDTEVGRLIDFEAMIPVDKEIEPSAEYGFKKIFHIENALYAKHPGTLITFNKTQEKFYNYIEEKGLMPITSIYTVFRNEFPDQSIDEIDIELYTGINPSIL